MTKYNTLFIETELLLAALNEDYDEVDRLVSGLMPGEQHTLLKALTILNDALYRCETEQENE